MKLTLKQKKFCDYYMSSGNATESAVKAGYSKKTAKQIGMENLTKPYFLIYIVLLHSYLSPRFLLPIITNSLYP